MIQVYSNKPFFLNVSCLNVSGYIAPFAPNIEYMEHLYYNSEIWSTYREGVGREGGRDRRRGREGRRDVVREVGREERSE